MSILIRGGYVINPATSMEENADVYIEGNEVKEIGYQLLDGLQATAYCRRSYAGN